MKAILNDDLLAVLAPVLHWYQSDEHPERTPLDILRDIVADLQSDRAAALAGAADKRRLDWIAENLTTNEGLAPGGYWHRSRIAWQGTKIREAIDATILSANEKSAATGSERNDHE